MILGGRFIQGLGAAAPGFVSTAMVRDGLAGSAMARVMSFVMTVFMLAPIIAPSIGQLVLLVLNWRFIFAGFVVIGFSAGVWLWVRQPETLSKDKRRPFSAKHYWRAGIEACRHPVMIGYTLAAGFVFSGLVAYLGTSQQIFVDQYQQGGYFALWFAAFAVALALAMIANGRFVMTIGMRRITQYALYSATCLSAISAGIAALYQGQPPLLLFGGYIFVNFFCMGLLFGNYNALALEPVGHIAGMASAMSGFISSSLSIIGGAIVGQAYHGTVTPLIVGFAIFGLMGIIVTEWAEAHRHSALEAKSGTP
jgi:DHA1 family bicyclomycin/chloramphenicol resistance-like MFS transporter